MVGLAENKANSAPLELELWLSLAIISEDRNDALFNGHEVQTHQGCARPVFAF